MLKVIKYGAFGLGTVVLIVFVLQLAGLEFQRYFAPKQQEVKRQVWEQTQSYRKSAVRDLRKYKRKRLELQKQLADTSGDEASILRRQIDAVETQARSRASELDSRFFDKYPDLEAFVEEIRKD